MEFNSNDTSIAINDNHNLTEIIANSGLFRGDF